MPKTKSRSYLTPQEVAQMLMVSSITIRQCPNKGWLKSQVTTGGHRRFSRRDVVGFTQQRSIALNLSESDGPRVLIVEDDVQVEAFLAEVLTERAHGVLTETAFDDFERVKRPPLLIPTSSCST